MYCPDCNQTMFTIDIVNKALQRWKDLLIPGDRAQHNRPDTMVPSSQERLDMAAYTFSYHMNRGCVLETDPFWGDINVQEKLLGTDLKSIHSVIVHCVSRKTVNATFSSAHVYY